MKLRVWIWTASLAFLGFSIGGKGAIERAGDELVGVLAGAVLGLGIGWSLQRREEKRQRGNQ